MNGASRFVDECDLERVQCQVLDLVCRPQRNDLDIILHRNFAEDTMAVFLRLRSQSERKLAFPIHRYTPDLVPLFADELQTNAVVRSGGDVLV